MKKNVFISLMVVMVPFCFTACHKGQSGELTQLTYLEPHLWEVTVPDHLDTVPQEDLKSIGADFHCSAVRNGNFYGRNLDFFISEIAEVVVHTPAKGKRHATVGIGRCKQATDEDLAKGLTFEQMSSLTWGMFDGINDAGLFCNINVVPFEDGGEPTTGTNPGMPVLYNALLVRALLDNCATVEEVMEYVNNHNIIGCKLGNFAAHFMIGDPNRTVILEFVDNKAVFVEDPELSVIMTNFYVSKLPELTPKADGVERYNILKEHYAEGGESMESMYNLMKRVRFSQTYDPNTKPFWKTEFSETGRYNYNSSVEDILADTAIQTDFARFKSFTKTGEYKKEWGLWFTKHVSVYDIAKRQLCVTVHENYADEKENLERIFSLEEAK